MTGLQLPIAEYSHSEGDAIIGGYVYHGTAISGLGGSYILGDYGTGKIWRLTQDSTSAWQRTLLVTGPSLSSFGRDSAGELYVLDYSGGAILKITP